MDQFLHPSKHLYWHALSHKVHHQFQSRHRLHIYKVVILTLSIFGLAFIIARSLPEPVRVLGESTSIPVVEQGLATPIPTAPFAVSTTHSPQPIAKNLVYYIAVSPKPVATMSGFLADELVLALGLPLVLNQPFPIKALVTDSLGATPSSTFNGRYVAVIENANSLNTSRIYESPSAIVSIQPAPASLLPYVLNKSYCASSSDCIMRDSACTQGAYNRYEPFFDNVSCQTHVMIVNASPSACSIVPTCVANRCQLINSCNE